MPRPPIPTKRTDRFTKPEPEPEPQLPLIEPANASTGALVENLRREAAKVYKMMSTTEPTSESYNELLAAYSKLVSAIAPFERMPSERLAGGEVVKRADVEDLLRIFFYSNMRALKFSANSASMQIESPTPPKDNAGTILKNLSACAGETMKQMKSEGRVPDWMVQIFLEFNDEV